MRYLKNIIVPWTLVKFARNNNRQRRALERPQLQADDHQDPSDTNRYENHRKHLDLRKLHVNKIFTCIVSEVPIQKRFSKLNIILYINILKQKLFVHIY